MNVFLLDGFIQMCNYTLGCLLVFGFLIKLLNMFNNKNQQILFMICKIIAVNKKKFFVECLLFKNTSN